MFKDVIRENCTLIKKLNNVGIEVLNPVTPKPEIPLDIALGRKQVNVQWTERTKPLVKWPEIKKLIKKKSGFEKVDLPRVAVGHSSYQGQSVLQRNPQRLHSLRAREGVRVQKFNCADKGRAVMKVYVDLYTATAIISGVCDSGKEVKGSVRKGSNN